MPFYAVIDGWKSQHVVVCFQIQDCSGVSKSRSVVSDTLRPHGLYSPWNSPGQNTEVGSLSLLQEVFPTQGLMSPGLPHCGQIFTS